MSRQRHKFAALTLTLLAGLLILIWVIAPGCTLPQSSETNGTVPPVQNTPAPNTSGTPAPENAAQAILAIADKSSCASYRWKDRSRAPIGYMRGVALSYQHALCNYRSPRTTASGVIGKALGDSDHDALSHYGIGKEMKGEERLTATYTLLLGLGMRESSGNYGEGYDKSAGPETASEAEAGAFQFSFNSIGSSPALRSLYEEYQAGKRGCLLDVFREGARGDHQSLVGVGAGRDFQAFTKSCPAFQAEYAAVLIRTLRRYAGPLNRKEAEYRPECFEMLSHVAKATDCNKEGAE